MIGREIACPGDFDLGPFAEFLNDMTGLVDVTIDPALYPFYVANGLQNTADNADN